MGKKVLNVLVFSHFVRSEAGSASRVEADKDSDPDPHQADSDPHHWLKEIKVFNEGSWNSIIELGLR